MEFFQVLNFILIIINIVMLIKIHRNIKEIRYDQKEFRYKVGSLRDQVERLSGKEVHEVIKKAPPAPDIEQVKHEIEPEVKQIQVVDEEPPVIPPGQMAPPVFDPFARLSSVPQQQDSQAPEQPVPPPAFPEPEPQEAFSGIQLTGMEILRKIWNWILYGKEQPKEGDSVEYAVATTWLARLGIIFVVAFIGTLLVISINRNYLTAPWRVVLSILAGTGMLITGVRVLGNKYRVLGEGMLGGGILVLYLSAYFIGPKYMLFNDSSMFIAFAMMILVTVTAGFLSISKDSLLTAVLGVAGGFMAPKILIAQTVNVNAFYGYMLILNLAVMGISYYKNWRLLNYLSFIFTYVFFYFASVNCGAKEFPLTMLFLTAYFLIHSSLVITNNIYRAVPATTLEVIHMITNTFVFTWFGYYMIKGIYGKPYPAVMSIGLAVFYAVQVMLFLRKALLDKKLIITLMALAATYAVWTLPLMFEKETLTISIALLALMFLWISKKTGSNFIQQLSYGLYLAVFIRLVWELHTNFVGLQVHDSFKAYLAEMIDRLWRFGSCILSIAGASYLQRTETKVVYDYSVAADNDIPQFVDKSSTTPAFYWFGLLFAFFFVHFELNAMFAYYKPMQMTMLTLLWCGMAVYFMFEYLSEKRKDAAFLAAMWVCIVVAVFKLFMLDLHSWNISSGLIYDTEYMAHIALIRLLDFAVVIGVLVLAWKSLVQKTYGRTVAPLLGYTALLLLFVYSTLELNTFLYWKMRNIQAWGISVLWAVYAASFVTSGLWKDLKALRYAGLVLFAVVAGKILIHDLRSQGLMSRMIAFFIVGVILLACAFIYIKYSAKFIKEDKD